MLAGTVAVVTGLAGCAAGSDAHDRRSGSGERKTVLAPIESAELVVRASSPPGYAVQVTSGLPNGCAAFERIDLARGGRELELTVWNTVPADAGVVCTMVYGTARHQVELGSRFAAGEIYRVRINGESRITFTAR